MKLELTIQEAGVLYEILRQVTIANDDAALIVAQLRLKLKEATNEEN
jgi:hypothetical protein